jgi:diguanylate cyclase (GGDEF)-like protein
VLAVGGCSGTGLLKRLGKGADISVDDGPETGPEAVTVTPRDATEIDGRQSTGAQHRWWRSPPARVGGLSLFLAASGTLLTVYALRWGAPPAPVHVPWWLLVPAFVLSNTFVFHLEVREEAHTFTLSELPLVIGLFFSAPWAIVVARIFGEAIYFGIRRRQALTKLVFNLSMFLAETAAAVVVFRLVSHGLSPLNPASWLPVLLAVATADLISTTAVSQAIRYHGGARLRLASVAGASGATAAANVALSLLAAIVLWASPFAILLFLAVAAATGFAYRSYANLSQRHAGLQLLYDFTKSVGASMRAETVMNEVLGEARKLLRAGLAEVVIFDRETGLQILCQRNSEAGPSDCATHDPVPQEQGSVWAKVVEEGQAIVVPRSARSADLRAFVDQLGVRDAIVAPLRSEDTVIGTIMVANRLGEVSTFDDGDRRLFETLANHASVAFENGRLVEKLRREALERRHEALHDALTGLPNRSLFIQRVQETTEAAVSSGRVAAVMLMDLDSFKEVNDTLGHHNGDLLLQEVARRLIEVAGPDDTVARLGGDEFAVVLPDLAGADQAKQMAARTVEALARPFLIDDLSLEVGASIGIALAPEHGNDAPTLLQRADVAMYEAKMARGGVAIYSIERDSYSPRRLALAGELRQAIDNGDVSVYYQPKARLSDGVVTSTEALVRWRHPVHGFLPPDEFIPVVEHTDLISVLTAHVLRSALSQCALWREIGHDLGVAVNLAMRSLLDTDLPILVSDLLRQLEVPPERLTLELTESSVMADPVRTITALERLASIGVQISVDDFGTGYSSLAYLQRLPVREVKVDKSFVLRMAVDPNDAIIVQSIVDLGHSLNLSVVAEGVEDQISWDRLRAMSCDIAQGYHLSKPVPASEVTRWLNERLQLEAGAMSTPAMSLGTRSNVRL